MFTCLNKKKIFYHEHEGAERIRNQFEPIWVDHKSFRQFFFFFNFFQVLKLKNTFNNWWSKESLSDSAFLRSFDSWSSKRLAWWSLISLSLISLWERSSSLERRWHSSTEDNHFWRHSSWLITNLRNSEIK